jgi:light-regulated signal transduction histidine kinase (bacteriophytochrome)
VGFTITPDVLPEDRVLADVDLSDCAREPIHLPGSIQGHGYLIVADPLDLAVIAISSNAAAALGRKPADLIGRSIGDLVSSSETDDIVAHLRKAEERPDRLHVRFPTSAPSEHWALSTSLRDGLLMVELWPRISVDEAERMLSVLRSDIARIHAYQSLEEVCGALAREMRALSGFDRVMVYRFDADWNGEVIAEARSPSVGSYLGHSFPAGDIPAQARELYRRATLRIIPDATYTPSPIIPPLNPRTGQPFDLTGVMLRSVSPVHLEYLANMGVAASMSVSIIRGGRLWGLVACHHFTPRLLPQLLLDACELLTQAVVAHMDARERSADAECLVALRQLSHTTRVASADEADYRARLLAAAPTLLDLTRSSGLLLTVGDTEFRAGEVPTGDQIRALSEWLEAKNAEQYTTRCLSADFPPAREYTAAASGVAAERLPGGWLVWFRKEWPHTQVWAGDPAMAHVGAGRINPRKSFESWRAMIRGQSRPWSDNDLFASGEIRMLVLQLVTANQVWRLTESERRLTEEKHNAEEASRAKSRFLANMSHELRTPLNAIIGFSDFMRQYPDATRPNLVEYAKHIKDSGDFLLNLINDLLDLSKVEAGKYTLHRESLDPREVVAEVVEDMSLRFKQAGIDFKRPAPGAPLRLFADRRALKQILLNLLSNALKFTPAPGRVTLALQQRRHGLCIEVADTGIGMSESLLSRIGQPFEQEQESMTRRHDGTGLGLALTKTLVELHGGSIAFASKLGAGTTVSVSLPLRAEQDAAQT